MSAGKLFAGSVSVGQWCPGGCCRCPVARWLIVPHLISIRFIKEMCHYCQHYRLCNGNWSICIAPPTRRPRTHHRVSPYPGALRQNETEMFSGHDETSPSIAAVSALSVACSMLACQQQKRLRRQFIDVSAARRGVYILCHLLSINFIYYNSMHSFCKHRPPVS